MEEENMPQGIADQEVTVMSNFETMLEDMAYNDETKYRIQGQGVRGAHLGFNAKNNKDSGYRDDVMSVICRPIGAMDDPNVTVPPSRTLRNGDKVGSIKNIDSDMKFVCDFCFKTVIMCEGKSGSSNNKNFGLTSMLSQDTNHTSYAMLVVYAYKPSTISTEHYMRSGGYDKPLESLTVVESKNGKSEVVWDVEDISVASFQAICENIMKDHQTSNNCNRTAKWSAPFKSNIWCNNAKCAKKVKDCTGH